MQRKFETEYMASLKETEREWQGEGCLDAKCTGKMVLPKTEARAKEVTVECQVCGTGLQKPTYAKWLMSKRSAQHSKIRINKQDIGNARASIEDFQANIRAKRTEILVYQANIRAARVELRKWR